VQTHSLNFPLEIPILSREACDARVTRRCLLLTPSLSQNSSEGEGRRTDQVIEGKWRAPCGRVPLDGALGWVFTSDHALTCGGHMGTVMMSCTQSVSVRCHSTWTSLHVWACVDMWGRCGHRYYLVHTHSQWLLGAIVLGRAFTSEHARTCGEIWAQIWCGVHTQSVAVRCQSTWTSLHIWACTDMWGNLGTVMTWCDRPVSSC
jgi:hypothetical protein